MSSRDIIQSLLQAKLELQDDEKLEQFWFTDDTRVAATIGTKNGPICFPVFNYTIRDDDPVTIGISNESFSYKWEKVSMSDEKLNVMCGGARKTFNITRAPKKERWLP